MKNSWHYALITGFLILLILSAANERHSQASSLEGARMATIPISTMHNSETPMSSEDAGRLRAKLAVAEYDKGVRETHPNCNCGDDIHKYTGGRSVQWCTAFASWIAHEAGTPITRPDGSWRTLNSQSLKATLEQRGEFIDKDDIISGKQSPQVGDFIIYYRGERDSGIGHVDIIIRLYPDGTADLLGGNVHDTISLKNAFPFQQSYGFQGIGRPVALKK